MSLCDKCQKRAIIYQKYSGMHLCSSHFEEDVHRKVRESLRRTRLFGRGLRVAFGLSGGNSSSTLLYILKNLLGCRKDIDFWAIIIDDEVDSHFQLMQARMFAERLNIPYVVKNPLTIDNATSEESSLPRSMLSNTKMELLNSTAQEIGADILATGHNLDDESVAIFMSYLRGDVESLFRLWSRKGTSGGIPWIKPLQRIPGKEVRLYAITHGLYSPESEVRKSSKIKHDAVKRHLNNFDSRHPGTKYSLLAGLDKVLSMRDEASMGGKAFK
jgi:tRNA(Ile)-lysidine synthase TilS/MesJ